MHPPREDVITAIVAIDATLHRRPVASFKQKDKIRNNLKLAKEETKETMVETTKNFSTFVSFIIKSELSSCSKQQSGACQKQFLNSYLADRLKEKK